MQEQRITYRLQTYWDSIRHDKHFPDIQQFSENAIADIWSSCFRVQVSRKRPPAFTYDYMGEHIVEAYGRDMTGLTVDTRMMHFPGSVLHLRLENMVHMPIPMQDNGHLINYDGKMIRYRACLLPFGTDGEGLTHIVCGISYRYF